MCFIIYPLFPQSQCPWSLQTPVCPLEQVHWCPLWQSARLKKVMDTHLHTGKHVSNFYSFYISFMGNIHVYKVWCKLFHFLNTFSSYSYSGLLYLCMFMLTRYQLANKSTLQESTFTYSTCYKLKMVRNQSGTYMINCLISPWIHDKSVVFSFQFH